MKHAFLIIAHSDKEQLKELLKALDYSENDIYIHIDKKSNINDTDDIFYESKNSKVIVKKKFDIRWGAESIVFCELFLFRYAMNDGYHDYYHIISGADYPLKKMSEIDSFFEKNKGKEFVHFDKKNVSDITLNRVRYYHFFNKYYKWSRIKAVHRLFFWVDVFFVKLQKILRISRELNYESIQKGCNWCSVTHEFVEYLLQEEPKIKNLVKFSECADEIFVQTVLINSKYKDSLFMPTFDDNYMQCVRYIIWDKCNVKYPKTLSESDYYDVRSSGCMFARKFSTEASKHLINHLKEDWLSNEYF